MRNLIYAFLICLLTTTPGCATYHVSKESLLDQFVTLDVERKGFFFANAVKGNTIESIKVLDKKGNEQIIKITDRTSIRITTLDNSRTTFYFNTLIVKDSSITGSKTHFFNYQIKPINFNDISKIEIQ